MLAKRIIPCLDVDRGRVVKGINFVGLRDAGDPVEIARRYNEQGAEAPTNSAFSTSPRAMRGATRSTTWSAAPPSNASCR